MIITTNSLDAGCGISDGSAWTSVTGVSPFGYLWNTIPSSSNDTIFNVAAGNYQVNITDNYGCMDSVIVSVNNPNSPIIDSIVAVDNLCFGDSSGIANSFVSAGTMPYTYSWSTGDTTANIANLPNGTYALLVTDSNNCNSNIVNVVISSPTVLNVSNSSTNESCLGCLDGSATAIVTGGAGPYTYNWSNSGTTSTINALSTGLYIVTVTDSLGCTQIDSVMVGSSAAIDENVMENEILIYPNPADEFVKIESKGSALGMVEIRDIQGKLIADFITKNSVYTINTYGWSVGIYLVKVYKGSGNKTYKLVKK